MDNQTSAGINTIPSDEAYGSIVGPEKKTLQPLTILLAVLIGIVALQALQFNSLARTIKSGATIQSSNQGTGSFLNTLKSQVGGCGG